MTPQQYILELTKEACAELDKAGSLAAVTRKAIRIARLRNDFENLLWLELEMHKVDNKPGQDRITKEVLPHFTKEAFDGLMKRYLAEWAHEREDKTAKDDANIMALTVEEMEKHIDHYTRVAQAAQVPSGMLPFDTAAFHDSGRTMQVGASIQRTKLETVLARVRERVSAYLSQSETQLVFGQLNADIFERNRQYVDGLLRSLCPEAFEQFRSAYERTRSGDVEARAHAMTSCRRILKTVADRLYPPTSTPIRGRDGKTRELSDEKYVARLWQYISDHCEHGTAGELLSTRADELGRRLDGLYDLACKGAHANVTEDEMNQCVIHTYLLIGDLLRLYDKTSAAIKN